VSWNVIWNLDIASNSLLLTQLEVVGVVVGVVLLRELMGDVYADVRLTALQQVLAVGELAYWLLFGVLSSILNFVDNNLWAWLLRVMLLRELQQVLAVGELECYLEPGHF
jgi:hypothetical protein